MAATSFPPIYIDPYTFRGSVLLGSRGYRPALPLLSVDTEFVLRHNVLNYCSLVCWNPGLLFPVSETFIFKQFHFH